MAASAAKASSTVSANTDTQSSVRQAGTTPAVETRPRLGLRPTMLLSPAGTRPDPAVSVPSASGTRPAPTAIAEPELDPPGMSDGIEQVARRAVGRAHADQAGGELVEIGLADDDGAGPPEPRDAGRVLARVVREGRAGGGGRQSRDVDIVLDRDRHAVEREIGIAIGRQRRGFGERVGFIAQRDENGGIAVGADARVGARDRRFGAARARTVRLHDRGYRLAHLHHPLPTVTHKPRCNLDACSRHFSKQHASRSGATRAASGQARRREICTK